MTPQFQLQTLNGYSYKLKNILIQSEYIKQPGCLVPLNNSLRFYNGLKNKKFTNIGKQIISLDMRGPYLAIGEKGNSGQLVSVHFMNIYQQQKKKQFVYCKTKVQKVCLSKNGKYLCSVSSPDGFVQEVYILKTQQNIQIATTTFYRNTIKLKEGRIVDIVFSNTDESLLAVMKVNQLMFLRINQQTEQVEQILVKSNRVREFNRILFDSKDKFCYTSSVNGDIAQINVQKKKQVRVGPRKRVILSGIKHLKFIDDMHMFIVGTKGFIALIELTQLKIIKQATINDEIFSVTDFKDGIAYLSTQKSTIYQVFGMTLLLKPFYVCQKNLVTDVAFCQTINNVFVTSAQNQITVWNMANIYPLIKIALPKAKCNCVCLDRQGKYIISGWNDSTIRIFLAKDGKQYKKMENCHFGQVKKVLINTSLNILISGGQKGQIRIWEMDQAKLGLIKCSFSYHTNQINCLKLNQKNYGQLLSCGQDGCYAIWDLQSYQRKYGSYICNFLKDGYFQNQYTVGVVGSGSYLYKVLKSDGSIIMKLPIQSSHANIIIPLVTSLNWPVYAYGGQNNFLYALEEQSQLTKKNIFQSKTQVFGQINCGHMAPDMKCIIVGTTKGTIIKLRLKQVLKNKQQQPLSLILGFAKKLQKEKQEKQERIQLQNDNN